MTMTKITMIYDIHMNEGRKLYNCNQQFCRKRRIRDENIKNEIFNSVEVQAKWYEGINLQNNYKILHM